jgi:ASC-1-like (ASCH) protein
LPYLHLAFIIKKNQLIYGISSLNGPGILGKKYKWLKLLPSRHAEHDLLEKLIKNKIKFNKIEIYSLLFKIKDNKIILHNAKPCKSCTKLMDKLNIKICYYSINNTIEYININNLLNTATDSKGAIIPKIWHDNKLYNTINIKKFYLNIKCKKDVMLIQNNIKTILCELWTGNIRKLHNKDLIYIKYKNIKIPIQITFIKRYKTLNRMFLYKNTLQDCCPNTDINTILSYYNNLYSDYINKNYDLVSIGIRVLKLPLIKNNNV